MAPELLLLKTNEKLKCSGNFIKSDVFSTAMSIMYIYFPDVSLGKEDRNKDEYEKVWIIRNMVMNEVLEH